MTRRIARFIVARYPLAWRERYQAEVFALLEEGPVRWRDVVDLTRGLAVERARSVLEPADHPAVSAAVYWLLLMGLRYAPGLVLAGALVLASAWMHRTYGEAPIWVAALGFVIALIGAVYHHRWYWPSNKAGIPGNDRLPIPGWRGSAVVTAVFAGLGLVLWTDPPEGTLQTAVWFYFLPGYVASQIRPRFTRSRQILWAFGALDGVKSQLKWAQMELDRCRALHAEGQWMPLADAEAAVKRLVDERDEILAVLNRCGYRARFQR